MTDTNHTPEPWYPSLESDGWRVMASDENGAYTLADMCCDDQEANARRIVACVNACAGISTENLEDNLPVKELARRYNEIIKQRDELLAALERIANPDEWDCQEIARAAIASVKGQT